MRLDEELRKAIRATLAKQPWADEKHFPSELDNTTDAVMDTIARVVDRERRKAGTE